MLPSPFADGPLDLPELTKTQSVSSALQNIPSISIDSTRAALFHADVLLPDAVASTASAVMGAGDAAVELTTRLWCNMLQ